MHLREGRLVRARAKHQQLRLAVFEAYGGAKCNCCGEKSLTMLNVDHIHNNGNKHRREVGGTRQVYRQILEMENPRFYFQVLCSNCNLSKVRNKGVCEHVTNKNPKTLFEAEGRFDRFKRRFDQHLAETIGVA